MCKPRGDEEALNAYWRAENFRRWPEAVVRDVAIPAASKTFLTTVGLPAPPRRIWMWSFVWDLNLPRISDAPQRRLLGSSNDRSVLIDEGRSGAIIWGKTDKWIERYANASVEQFALSLTEMDRFLQHHDQAMGDPDVRAQRRIVAGLKSRLKGIDASAIADRESLWWNIVFEMWLDIEASIVNS